MKHQHGFTLLELMVAMAIFAMLAVAGWQVFDSVNRARERAQFHADNLAVLQYAYLQLQQDMSQIIPYQALDAQSDNIANNSLNADSQANEKAPEPFMSWMVSMSALYAMPILIRVIKAVPVSSMSNTFL